MSGRERPTELESIQAAAAAAEPPPDYPGPVVEPFGDYRDDIVAKVLSDAAHPVAEALDAVDVFLERYVHFESDEQRHAIALWVAATWVYDAFDVAPYLHVKSPEKRSGKTLLLDLVELLARDPIATNDMSPAALYRVVDDRHPTLLWDEVDAVFTKGRNSDPAKDDLRGLLNAGYRKGRKVYRVGGARRDTLEGFDVFSMKMLAGIGDLPDTVADRSITVALQRKPRSVSKARFRSRKVRPVAEALADLVDAAMIDRTDALAEMDPHLPDELNDREQDTWELLFAVADLADGHWPRRARAAAIRLSHDAQDASETIGIKLLVDLAAVWKDDEPAVPTSVLLARLHALDESPWGDWYGRPIDARFLAQKLKPFGITSKTVKWQSKTPKGYRREHLDPVWDRYDVATFPYR